MITFPSTSSCCVIQRIRNRKFYFRKHYNEEESESDLGRATSPLLTAENNYAIKSSLVTLGCPTFTPQNCLFPSTISTHLICSSLDRPYLPPQTASGSNQPFCHSSHVRTDRWDVRMFSNISALLAILIESDALKRRRVEAMLDLG